MSEATIEPEKARDMLATGEARAIDLRPIEELGQTHAPSAVFVAGEEVSEAARRVLRDDEVKLIVFCEDGSESADTAARLSEDGIDAAAVAGGWRAWTSASMPIQPGDDEEYSGPKLKQPGTGETLSEGDADQDEVPDAEEDAGEDEDREGGGAEEEPEAEAS